MGSQLSTAQRNAVSRISGLVLTNAMIFQEILAEHEERVLPLQRMLAKEPVLDQVCTHWQFILEQINYYPIFHVAREILLCLTADKSILDGLRSLGQTAQRIVGMRAALRHDLMGRVYHRLLAEAKYLATYYTGIPAATLLLKLALRPGAWPTKWHILDDLREFRVADIACGTGTLLVAAAESLADNYISESARRGRHIDIGALHKIMAEHIIHGYDVLPSAVHLTASTLALRAPQIAFLKMNLYSLPFGGAQRRLGSIEFLKEKRLDLDQDLFATTPMAQQITGEAERELPSAPLPALDLCVMNPPFTRSVGGNLLFGSAPENERRYMQKDLKKVVRKSGISASITAGLGSVFVGTADAYVKKGGRIAFVLPKALLSGVAWAPTRKLLARDYRAEYFIASHEPGRWNFSESTKLSEVLVVAAKVGRDGQHKGDRLIAVNLWRNPSTAFEALAVAHSLAANGAPDTDRGQGALDISVGDEKIGEAIACPWRKLKDQSSWLLPCAFAQSDLIRAAYYLAGGSLWLPGRRNIRHVPLCSLGQLGSLGPDARDIHDGFELSRTPTPYRAFWGHNAKCVYTIAQEPNRHLSPLPRAKEGRSLRRVGLLWPRAAKILIAERLRLNTQRLVSVRLPEPVLSNTWWPLSLSVEQLAEQREKALVLWLNSTLGFLLVLLHRVETEGAWVEFKKPLLANLPVLDVQALAVTELEALASAYDGLSSDALGPFPEINTDAVRARIDGVIARVLHLPDVSVLRELLAREPVVCLKRL